MPSMRSANRSGLSCLLLPAEPTAQQPRHPSAVAEFWVVRRMRRSRILPALLCAFALHGDQVRADPIAPLLKSQDIDYDPVPPEAYARMKAAERAERLAIFIIDGFDNILTMEPELREILDGQFFSFGGSIINRDNPVLLKARNKVALRLHLRPEDQATLQKEPEGTRTAYFYGTIRRIVPKTRTIEIDVTEITFHKPK